MSGPTFGTHYAHRSGGVWVDKRISTSIAGVDLALDASGNPRLALVTDSFHIRYYHLSGGAFASVLVGPAANALLARIAVDAHGRAVIIWTQPSLPNGIYFTRQT